jgi:hypothetical protein
MPLRVAKLERDNTAGRRRQTLRAGSRDRAPTRMSLKGHHRCGHIGNYDREMLKRGAVGRHPQDRPGRHIDQLHTLTAELQQKRRTGVRLKAQGRTKELGLSSYVVAIQADRCNPKRFHRKGSPRRLRKIA